MKNPLLLLFSRGPSGTDLKGEDCGGEFTEYWNIAFPEKDPSSRFIMGKKTHFTGHYLFGGYNTGSADRKVDRVQSENGKWFGAMVRMNPSAMPKKEALPPLLSQVELCLQLVTLSEPCSLTTLCNLL